MRVLLVGQAPSRDTCGGPPFSGRSGRRLADLAGVKHDELREVFALVNLLDRWPGKNGRGDAFPMGEARAAAARLDLSKHDVVVLVGKSVARAFGIGEAEYFAERVGGVFVVPHPSGVNRWWNDAANEERARRFMEELKHAAEQS